MTEAARRYLRGARRLLRQRRWDHLRPPACPSGYEVAPPDFVGVGAQKAGTSWWFALIVAHPQVYFSPGLPKELHFFDRFWRQPFTQEHASMYHRFFPRPPGGTAGEWTPRYMADFWTAPLLERAAPDARLLVLLRDPVERYRSGLTHEFSLGAPSHPMTAVEAFDRGMYHQQLLRLLHHFSRDQLLVLQYEQCQRDIVGQLRRTYAFIGVDDEFVPEGLTRRVNETRARKMPLRDADRRLLIDRYAEDVGKLLTDFDDIDLTLWPNFTRVA